MQPDITFCIVLERNNALYAYDYEGREIAAGAKDAIVMANLLTVAGYTVVPLNSVNGSSIVRSLRRRGIIK